MSTRDEINDMLTEQFPAITSDWERERVKGLAVAEVNVQWKNVDICADVQCPCADTDEMYAFHIDGWVFGKFRCPRCGKTFQLPWSQFAFEVEPDPSAAELEENE